MSKISIDIFVGSQQIQKLGEVKIYNQQQDYHYQCYFHGPYNIHGSRKGGADVEQNPHSTTKLRTQGSGDHEIGS